MKKYWPEWTPEWETLRAVKTTTNFSENSCQTWELLVMFVKKVTPYFPLPHHLSDSDLANNDRPCQGWCNVDQLIDIIHIL